MRAFLGKARLGLAKPPSPPTLQKFTVKFVIIKCVVRLRRVLLFSTYKKSTST